MSLIYKLIAAWLAVCLLLLLLPNLIPHVSVKGLGWFSLKNVTISLSDVTIRIETIKLWVNFSISMRLPFRMINFGFTDLRITYHPSGKKKSHKSTDPPQLPLDITFAIPLWVYKWLFKNSWINQFNVHLFRTSIYHEALDKNTSLHLDYIRLHTFFNLDSSKQNISFSATDAYIRDESGTCDSKNQLVKVLRTLITTVSTILVFSCCLQNKGMMFVAVKDVKISVSLVNPYVPFFNAKQREKSTKTHSDAPERSPEYYNKKLSSLLRLLRTFAGIELKVENSHIEWAHCQFMSSSLFVSLNREESYTLGTLAKLAIYGNSVRFYEKESKVVTIPSFTYLFEADLSQLLEADQSQDYSNFKVDINTSFDLTNPNFDIYFDQLELVFSKLRPNKAPKSEDTSDNGKTEKRKKIWARISKRIGKINTKFSITDTNVVLHLPGTESGNFYRGSVNNMIIPANCSLMMFKFTSKLLGKMLDENMKPNQSRPTTLKSLAKIKNLHVDVVENLVSFSKVNALVSYCLDSKTFAFKIMSKRVQFKSVNDMIFKVVRSLRESYIEHYNNRCASIKKSAVPVKTVTSAPEEEKIEFIDMMELLPDSISKIKFKASSFLGTIICKDGLPSHVVHDPESGMEFDLNQFKRGVSMSITDQFFDFNRKNKIFCAKATKIEWHTHSDFQGEYVEEFDEMASGYQRTSYDKGDDVDFSDILSLESTDSTQEAEASTSFMKRVLTINNAMVSNREDKTDELMLSVPEIDGRLDIFLFWCFFYAKSLLEMFKPNVEQTYSKEDKKQLNTVRRVIKLDVKVHSVAIVVRLPHDVDVLFEIDSLKLTDVVDKQHMNLKYTRLYVIHPSTHLWTRLVSIHNTSASMGDLIRGSTLLDSRSIRLNVPYGYLLYTVIDNVITFAKAIKQLSHNFKKFSPNIKDYETIMPSATKGIQMPHIEWRANSFALTLEDDIFENELGMIFEFGLIQQRARIKKWALFEEKSQQIRDQADQAIELSESEAAALHRTLSPKHKCTWNFGRLHGHTHLPNHVPTAGEGAETVKREVKRGFTAFRHHNNRSSNRSENLHPSKSDSPNAMLSVHSPGSGEELDKQEKPERTKPLSQEEAEVMIQQAEEDLKEEISSSWIASYQKFKYSKLNHWDRAKLNTFGNDDIDPTILNKYKVQDYARGPPLMTTLFKGFHLLLEKARVKDIDEFLRIHGKGQPKFDYSILVPAFGRIVCKSLFASLKDYALPLVSFPSNEKREYPTMVFEGNFVVNEKLILRPEELRRVFVGFLPAAPREKEVDNFYSIFIPRTLTPVKFMFDFECSLNTERACTLTWCKSYSAAILSMSQALDSFSKPQIDDSPIGWWDKLALIMHGRMRFLVENELCMYIKSSPNPYHLLGKNAGLVWCWRDNVDLKINYSGKQLELIQLNSHDFVLGIPDHSLIRTLSDMLYNLTGSLDMNNENQQFQKRLMKFSSDEKVKWTFGFSFERNKDTKDKELDSEQERTLEFKPHYEIMTTNPECEFHPDSYEGFRSDYLHMVLAVHSTSKKGAAHNTAYFTPMAFHYFFYWWNTISKNVSLPIRQGPIFNQDRVKKSSLKFGNHFSTFKYQIDVEPLTVSHTYFSFEDAGDVPRVACYGLKGKCSSCHVDLHQRKEVVRYVNQKLNINKKMRHLKLHLGRVSVGDVDIRLFKASFQDPSIRGSVVAYYTDKLKTMMNADEYRERQRSRINAGRNWARELKVSEGDFSWLDVEDFVELEQKESLSADPDIKFVPLCSTPKFTYFREFSLEDPNAPHPFGYEHDHNCLIYEEGPERVQARLFKERVDALKEDIKTSEETLERLHKINDPTFDADRKRLKKEIKDAQDRITLIRGLQKEPVNPTTTTQDGEYILPHPVGSPHNASRLSLAVPEPESDSHSGRRSSRALSNYSSYNSIEQAREVSNEKSDVSEFHNRFLIHNIRFKWNNTISNLFQNYMVLIGERKKEVFMLTRKAVELMESFHPEPNNEDLETGRSTEVPFENIFKCSNDVIEDFSKYLVQTENDNCEIEHRYLIKFIRPQIQLISDADPNSCVLVTALDLEMRIISENIAGTCDIISEDTVKDLNSLESRTGVLFTDAQAFVFQKKDCPGVSDSPYGQTSSKNIWPPWVDLEVCNSCRWLTDELVIEKTSLAIMLKKPNLLFMDSRQSHANELSVHMSKIVVNATSEQYLPIHFVVFDLLLESKSGMDDLHMRLNQMAEISGVDKLSGFEDMVQVGERVKQLQDNVVFCETLLQQLGEAKLGDSDESFRNRYHVEYLEEKMKTELAMIIRAFNIASSRSRGNQGVSGYVNINADQIIWHMLDTRKEPLVDFASAPSRFHKVDLLDGTHTSVCEISLIQGFNLRKDGVYPELLKPMISDASYDSKKPMIVAKWKRLDPVGGISIMKNAELSIQPTHLQLDFDTARKLQNYVFPKEDNDKDETEIIDKGRISPDSEDLEEAASTISSGSKTKSLNPFRKIIARRSTSGTPERVSNGDYASSSRESQHESSRKESSFNEESSEISSSNGSDAYTGRSESKYSELIHKAGAQGRKHQKAEEQNMDNLAMIMSRSSKYSVIEEVKVTSTKLQVSFRAPPHLHIIDVHNLMLNVPAFHYREKTWSSEDFVNRLKKDVIKVILSHTGKILGNKFKVRKRRTQEEPLKQIKDYTRYMTLDDLQEDGRETGEIGPTKSREIKRSA